MKCVNCGKDAIGILADYTSKYSHGSEGYLGYCKGCYNYHNNIDNCVTCGHERVSHNHDGCHESISLMKTCGCKKFMQVKKNG